MHIFKQNVQLIWIKSQTVNPYDPQSLGAFTFFILNKLLLEMLVSSDF